MAIRCEFILPQRSEDFERLVCEVHGGLTITSCQGIWYDRDQKYNDAGNLYVVATRLPNALRNEAIAEAKKQGQLAVYFCEGVSGDVYST